MPRFDLDSYTQENFSCGNYQYSGTKIEDLGASEYTLVTIAVDVSGSVETFKDSLTKCLKSVVDSCKYSPRAENLMIRLVLFNNTVEEIHGFKLLQNINLSDYDVIIKPGGMTALYDASANSIASLVDYAKNLNSNNYDVNGLIVIITDGYDNSSTSTKNTVKNALLSVKQNEIFTTTPGLLTILVGVYEPNNPMGDVISVLEQYKDEVGFNEFTTIDTTAKSFAKLGMFISKSISSQSQRLAQPKPSLTI